MLNQNISTPLYEQMKYAIKEEIKNKVYMPGEKMPSETELEKKYQVSRITVRRAVKELCDEGILVRRQGKGTFVTDNTSYGRLDRGGKGFHGLLEEQGKKASVQILEKSIVHVKPSYAEDLSIDAEDEVVLFKRVMFADEIPIMIDTCYIPLKRFPGIYDKLDENTSVFRLMEEEYHVSMEKYYKVLKVCKATKEMSRLLNCHAGDPMFDLFKITYDRDKKPQIICISILKGDNTYYVISSENGEQMNQDGMVWRA